MVNDMADKLFIKDVITQSEVYQAIEISLY